MKRFSILIVALLCGFLCGAQNSLSVDAPGVVSVDETFRVVFTADGKMSDFNWTPSDDFDIVWGPQRGSMSSTSIINGKRTSTHQETTTYLLRPKKEGKFTIASATAVIDKNSCTSRSLTIEVVGSQQQSQQAQQQYGQQNGQQSGQQNSQQSQNDGYSSGASSNAVSGSDIFLRMSLSKTSVVKGEPLMATLKLYTRADIAGFEDVRFPTFDGFWSREVDTPQNIEFNRESVGGTIYNAALIRRYMLIPQKSGQITIDPAEMVCQIRVRTSSGGHSIFDDFFDSYQTVRKRISTQAIKVEVRNLPSGAPASFAGGVGDFKMTTRLSKEQIKSHEAVSLFVTITGKGNISMLEAPEFEFPSDFELYDAKTTDAISSDGTSGSRTFEFPFIPRSHGDFTIGPIEYSYYDIQKGRYATLSTDPIQLSIEKGDEIDNGGVVVPGVSRQGVRNLAEDIRFIKTSKVALRDRDSFFAGSWAFYVSVLALIALFFAAAFLIRKMEAVRSDVAGSRNRKANKMARSRLRQGGEYLKENLPGAFYQEMHKAVLGYVSDKLAIPSADLSRERISEILVEKGVLQKTIDDLCSIIEACEFARYSPQEDHSAMESHYNDALRIISELESQMKNSNRKSSSASGAAKSGAMLLLALCLSAAPLMAQASEEKGDVNELWKMGNDAYSAGEWKNAINFYQMIEGENLVCDDLYYNLGNAFFKNGDYPHAILYYERCLKLNPSHKDAENNLSIAQQFTMDKIDIVPEFILATWVKDVKYWCSSDGWAVIALCLAAVSLVLLLLFRFSSSYAVRKISFIFACVAFLAAVVSFIFSISEKRDFLAEDTAIIIQPVVNVKSSPDEGGKSIFVIHEGTKVNLLDDLGQWSNIELSDGRQGWVLNREMEKI